MNALLLAAGEGTRLRPLTLDTPKCLAPVIGHRLLEVWLNLLERGPCPAACWINTSYLAHKVDAYIARKAPSLTYAVHAFYEKRLLGTAGTLQALLPQLHGHDLLLAHADNLSWFDLKDFNEAHRQRPAGTEITMMTFETDSPQSCGIVVTNQSGVLEEFHEKVSAPPGNIANGAVYLLSPKALQQIEELGPVFEFSTQVIPHFLGKTYCWQNTVYHRDIGNPQSLAAAQDEFRPIAAKFGIFNL